MVGVATLEACEFVSHPAPAVRLGGHDKEDAQSEEDEEELDEELGVVR